MDVVSVGGCRLKNEPYFREGKAPAEPTTDAETHGSAGASPSHFQLVPVRFCIRLRVDRIDFSCDGTDHFEVATNRLTVARRNRF